MKQAPLCVLLALLCTVHLLHISSADTIPVNLRIPATQPVQPVPANLFSIFLENLNHAVEGGLSAQLINDVQCRGPVNTIVRSFQSAVDPAVFLRHCDYIGFASMAFGGGGSEDASFFVEEALDGSDGFSLRSVNFPTYYITAASNGQIRLLSHTSGIAFAVSASFTLKVVLEQTTMIRSNLLPGAVLTRMSSCQIPSGCDFIAHVCHDVLFVDASDGAPTEQNTWIIEEGLAGASPWRASLGVTLQIDSAVTLNQNQTSSLSVTIPQDAGPDSGVCNLGYWGMAVRAHTQYNVDVYIQAKWFGDNAQVSFSLQSEDSYVIYASETTALTSDSAWHHYTAVLTANATNAAGTAVFCIQVRGGSGTFWLSAVSVISDDTFHSRPNGIRRDLAEFVSALRPPAMRWPGGCYIMGLTLPDAYNFTQTIGPLQTRAGHQNWWGYWSVDWIGFHEYLQFTEDLGTENIWVVSSGITRDFQYVHGDALRPFIDLAVNSLHYAMADPDENYYAAIRREMGHPKPFEIPYVAVGNENCMSYATSTYYPENFNAIASAIRAAYPFVKIIANCDLTGHPFYAHSDNFDLWDFHVYESPDWFYQNEFLWDAYSVRTRKVFASEYAVTQDCGTGNFRAALAEAVWMTGMERNSDLVLMSSYAPLFVNINDHDWNPNAIVFNSTSVYGTPSYWLQRLFSNNTAGGGQLLPFNLTTTPQHAKQHPAPYRYSDAMFNNVANASVTVMMDAIGDVVIKYVNWDMNSAHNVTVQAPVEFVCTLLQQITAQDWDMENSLEEPSRVAIVEYDISHDSSVVLPPGSINVIRLVRGVISR